MHKVLIIFWKRNWNVNLIFSFFSFFLLITWPAQVQGNFFAVLIYLSRKVVYGCLPTEKGDGREREVGKDCGEKGSIEGGKFLCSHGQWRPDTEVTGAGGGRADFGRWGTLYPCPPPPKTLYFTPASSPSTNPSPIVETRDISKSFFISSFFISFFIC